MLIVGTEWLVEAAGCDAARLRDVESVRAVLGRAVAELDLRVVGDVALHKFAGAGGVTGLALLTESHLACHTYPEFGVATFNLYCCRARPRWAWEERLAEMLGASRVSVRVVERRVSDESSASTAATEMSSANAATALSESSYESAYESSRVAVDDRVKVVAGDEGDGREAALVSAGEVGGRAR